MRTTTAAQVSIHIVAELRTPTVLNSMGSSGPGTDESVADKKQIVKQMASL